MQTKHAGETHTHIQEATRTREDAQEILRCMEQRGSGILRLASYQYQPHRGMRNVHGLLTLTRKRQLMSHATRLGSPVTLTRPRRECAAL
jgi:hypothetical protein